MKSIFRGAGYETEERYFEEQNRRFLNRQAEPIEDDEVIHARPVMEVHTTPAGVKLPQGEKNILNSLPPVFRKSA